MPSPPAASRYRLVPIMLTQGVGLACGLASVRLNSHLIPPEILGFYGIFLTFTPLGMWVVNAGLLKFVSRHWAAAPRKPVLAREILGAWARRLPWLAAAAALAAWLMLRSPALPPVLVWGLLFPAAALLAVTALAQNALQAERAHWRDFAVAATAAVMRSFLPPLLYAATGGAVSLLLGFSAHTFVAAAVALWAVRTLLRREIPPDSAATGGFTGVYDGPLFTALAVAGWVAGSMNRWLVAWFYGEHEAGYFTLIGSAAVIVTSMLGTIIMQYVQPGLFALGDGSAAARPVLARRCDLAALAYAVSAGLLLAAVRALIPWLVGPLISPVYRDAVVWLVPAGCFGIATITAAFYHVMLLAGRRERFCGVVDLTSVAVLAIGSCATAALGPGWFARWLMVTPLLPWLLTRTLARHYFFKPGSDPTPAPVP